MSVRQCRYQPELYRVYYDCGKYNMCFVEGVKFQLHCNDFSKTLNICFVQLC